MSLLGQLGLRFHWNFKITSVTAFHCVAIGQEKWWNLFHIWKALKTFHEQFWRSTAQYYVQRGFWAVCRFSAAISIQEAVGSFRLHWKHLPEVIFIIVPSRFPRSLNVPVCSMVIVLQPILILTSKSLAKGPTWSILKHPILARSRFHLSNCPLLNGRILTGTR